jgi:Mg2+/Co2+ transporter CorB
MASMSKNIIQEEAGIYLIDGSATIRELNKDLHWSLPIDGPKTLNGYITELLGFIPPPDCCLKISNTPCEILQVKDNTIKTVRIGPTKGMQMSL